MRFTRFCLLVLLIIYSATIYAQSITGRVTDMRTGMPIAYVNIGLPGKNLGATTDEQGNYNMPIPGTTGSDTVRISMIGYQPQITTVSNLLAQPDIMLQPREHILSEVVVRPHKLHHKVLGYTNNNKHVIIGFSHYKPGYELGALLKIKHERTYLDSIRINIAQCGVDSIFLRLNIAEQVDDSNFTNILTQPIYIKAATKDALENLVVDLTQYHLVASQNILVSVELMRDFGEKRMWLCAALFGRGAYMRTISQAPWTHLTGAGLAISAYVTY